MESKCDTALLRILIMKKNRSQTAADFLQANQTLFNLSLMDRAKAVFGVTENFSSAAFVLPDGSVLDFKDQSGRMDHGEIRVIFTEKELKQNPLEYIEEKVFAKIKFMKAGAIRIAPESGTVELYVPPTRPQIKTLKRLLREGPHREFVFQGSGFRVQGSETGTGFGRFSLPSAHTE